MNVLGALFSSQVKADIVGQLFSIGARPIHLRDLARTIDCGFSAVQREAKRLSELGILIETKDGNRTYLHSNPEHPFFDELVGLVRKSKGSLEILRQAIGKKDIDLAFVFGSITAKSERLDSDVDMMILGEIGLREVVKRLTGVSSRIGREINPHVMTSTEFSKRSISDDHFVSTVWNQPKQFLVGNEDDLSRMAK